MFDFISNFNLKLSSTQGEFGGILYMTLGINVNCLLFYTIWTTFDSEQKKR